MNLIDPPGTSATCQRSKLLSFMFSRIVLEYFGVLLYVTHRLEALSWFYSRCLSMSGHTYPGWQNQKSLLTIEPACCNKHTSHHVWVSHLEIRGPVLSHFESGGIFQRSTHTWRRSYMFSISFCLCSRICCFSSQCERQKNNRGRSQGLRGIAHTYTTSHVRVFILYRMNKGGPEDQLSLGLLTCWETHIQRWKTLKDADTLSHVSCKEFIYMCFSSMTTMKSNTAKAGCTRRGIVTFIYLNCVVLISCAVVIRDLTYICNTLLSFLSKMLFWNTWFDFKLIL